MTGEPHPGDSPTSPIDILVAATASRRLSLGARSSLAIERASFRLGHVPEDSVAPDGDTLPSTPAVDRSVSGADAFLMGSVLASPHSSFRGGGGGGERMMSGVALPDLLLLTSDPLLQQRVAKADSGNKGRISRADLLGALQREASAKQNLRRGLIAGSVLLAFCLLMLAANAALTYAVVAMSKDTSVQPGGVMTARAGGEVVGTGEAAETADLLFAHHTPAEQAAALLSLHTLLVTEAAPAANDSSAGVTAYQVLSAHLVPGQRLEFVVAAPAGADAAGAGSFPAASPASDLARIVIDEEGVHEVRGSSGAEQAGGSRRRLLASQGQLAGGVQGRLTTTATRDCAAAPGTCSAAAASLGCPPTPTCGYDGRYYPATCLVSQGRTSVKCTNCGNTDAECATAQPTRAPLPGTLVADGPGFVRSPPAAGGGGQTAGVAGGMPTSNGCPPGYPANLVCDGPGFVRRPPPAAPPGGGGGNGEADTAEAGGGKRSPPPPSPRPRPPKPRPPAPRPRPPPPRPRPRPPPPRPRPRPPPPRPKAAAKKPPPPPKKTAAG